MSAKVLVADDEPFVLTLVEETFRILGAGLDLLFARSGEEAVALARRHRPDVIVLDVSMPDRNGFEVCGELKRDSATSHAKVVILTGLDDAPARHRAIDKVGADRYLSKPWNPVDLLDAIQELLGAGHDDATRADIRDTEGDAPS